MKKLKSLEDLGTPAQDNAIEEILLSLAKKDSDLQLKTQIRYPHKLAVLSLLKQRAQDAGLKGSFKLLELYHTEYLANMVSYKRQGRKELIDAIKHKLDSEANYNKKEILFKNLKE